MSAIFEFLGKLLDMSKRLPGARRDAKRKATLRELLEKDPKIKWISIGTLADSIGASRGRSTSDPPRIGWRRTAARRLSAGGAVSGLSVRTVRPSGDCACRVSATGT